MKTAIIIDDNYATIVLVKNLISYYSFPIEVISEISNGKNAFSAILEKQPDIVFMDISLPDISGLEVIDMLREQRNIDKKINYIIITAYGYFEYAQKSLRLGVNDILLKPIDKEQFYDAVSHALGDYYTDSELLNEIIDFLENNYRCRISLKELSERFNVNDSYISRLFKHHLDTTYSKFLNSLRLNNSLELLSDCSLSIESIAEAVGYNNTNYYYKVFKTEFGITPNEYRKKTKWFN